MKHTLYRRFVNFTLGFLIVVAMANSAYAQTAPPTTTVTDDQVNSIAHKLYCPVCENITLDTCATAACADWRNEIHIQLEAGRTEDQIIADFVQRFGDRVVGTPQDSVLRALSLVTPWLIIAVVLILIGRVIFARSRVVKANAPTSQPAVSNNINQKYHDLLEKDLEE
jgi:cytochrome c-type biogenesis protein CcmH/NrfF